jgi:1-acyl-sn-glycerol-3-phosphate acyltransferase
VKLLWKKKNTKKTLIFFKMSDVVGKRPELQRAWHYTQRHMAHPVLFVTSLCMIVPHLAAVLAFGGPLILQWSYLCGLSTSVWNHGTVNRLAMWCDRIMMTVGCAIDFYFILSLPLSDAVHLLFLTIMAVTAYAVAKYITGGARAISADGRKMTWSEVNPWASLCHVVAHVCVCISHYSMLNYISQNDEDTQAFDLKRCLALTAGVMPLFLYFHDVLVMPAMLRSLWVVMNAILWAMIIGVPCMLCVFLIPIVGLSVVERMIWQCGCVYFKIILWASAVSVEIIGLESLDPHANYLFACNHVASYDIPVIFSALPYWIIFVSKSTVAYIPIFGWLVWLGGTVFVERSNHGKCIEAMKNGVDSLRQRPKSVILFPEGRRSDDGKLQEFKRGGFLLAIQSKLPVVPVALIGTYEIAGRGFSSSIRPRHVTVVIGTPVETKCMDIGDRHQLASWIHSGMLFLFRDVCMKIRDES